MKTKKLKIIVFIIFSIGFLIGVFFTKNFFKAKENLESSNSLFAYFVDGVETFDMPKKDSGYTLSSESNCNNGVTVLWDNTTWSAEVDYGNFEQGVKERTRCNLYFVAESTPIRVVNVNDTTGMWQYKENITNLIIQNELKTISNAVAVNDESESKNGSVMSYVVENEDGTTYTAYLQGDGIIYLNSKSRYLFKDFDKLQTIEGMEYLNATNVTDMIFMFDGCSSLTSLDLTPLNTTNVTDMSYMFRGCSSLTSLDLTPLNTTNVTDMSSMFNGCSSLTTLDLSSLDTMNVTDMSYMFSGCSSLTSLDLTPLNTTNVTDMGSMFSGCSSFTSLDLIPLNTTNVTDMSSMFSDCSSLTSLDLSSLDTMNVTDMSYMFSGCSSFTSLDLSSLNTANVTDMSYMFSRCRSLTSLDLSSLNTANVTDMSYMFSSCSSLTNLDLSSLNTANVTNMFWMFFSCSNLTKIIYGDYFIHASEADVRSMFYDCPANKPTHESWNGVTF